MRAPIQICAIQCSWPLAAYRDTATFSQHVRSSVEPLHAQRQDGIPCLVAFPEFIGLPLVFLGHAADLAGCSSWTEAITRLIGLREAEVRATCVQHGVGPVRALFLSRSAEIRAAMTATFGGLAAEYGLYIAAGSAPLPQEGAADGRVFNTCQFFGPDGAILGEQRKVHPYDREGTADGLDISAAAVEDVAVISTDLGRVGIAICYDAWHEDVMSRLAEQQAELVIQPSANAGPWNEWQEGDWERGLLHQLRDKRFPCGVNPMMVGAVFSPEDEYACQGRSAIIEPTGYRARAQGRPWSEYRQEEVVITTLHRNEA